MKFNEETSNPMLVGALQLLRAEDTPEHRKLFTGELTKAVLVSPVFIDPAPFVDEKGVTIVEKGAKVQFPFITANDGKRFFVAFTDIKTMNDSQDANGNTTPAIFKDNHANIRLEEFGAMFAAPTPGGAEHPISGVAINPFNENIVINKDMAISIFKEKMDAVKNNIEKMKQ